MAREIRIESIRTDGGTQPRQEMDSGLVEEYAEAMGRGDAFPPVEIVQEGSTLWLVDGFHRVAAAELAGLDAIQAEVSKGTQREAVWRSLAANARHGKRRSRADLRRAVERALCDEQWTRMSDREIARHLGCSHPTVAKYRGDLVASGKIYQIDKRVVSRGGSTYTQDTTQIGDGSSHRGEREGGDGGDAVSAANAEEGPQETEEQVGPSNAPRAVERAEASGGSPTPTSDEGDNAVVGEEPQSNASPAGDVQAGVGAADADGHDQPGGEAEQIELAPKPAPPSPTTKQRDSQKGEATTEPPPSPPPAKQGSAGGGDDADEEDAEKDEETPSPRRSSGPFSALSHEELRQKLLKEREEHTRSRRGVQRLRDEIRSLKGEVEYLKKQRRNDANLINIQEEQIKLLQSHGPGGASVDRVNAMELKRHIKSAIFHLHPDRGGGDVNEALQAVQAAYEAVKAIGEG